MRAIVVFWLAAVLTACGVTQTGAPAEGPVVTRASVSTTGVAITDVIPGPVQHARMNDAGLIAYVTGATGYVYDTNTKVLTDLNDVAPCPPTSSTHRYEVRDVSSGGLVLFVCAGGDGSLHSYVWDAVSNSTPIALPGLRTRAFDMNDAGTVVGWAIFDFGTVDARQRGFVWHLGDSYLTEILPVTETGITNAYQVNNNGQVLGAGPANDHVDGLGANRYYLIDPASGLAVVTGMEAGGGGDFEQALLNDLGDMVGINFVRNASPQQRRVFHRAADGTVTDLGLGQIRGFNGSSTVVFSNDDGIFSWSPSTPALTSIEVPGGTFTAAVSLDEDGRVALSSTLAGDRRALLWEPTTGSLTELGVPADDPNAQGAEPRAMNAVGQIVGQYLSHPTFHGVVWSLQPAVVAPPTADAGGPYSVIAGNAVSLDGTGSSDPHGASLTFEWDFDHDGLAFTVDATGPTAVLATTEADGGRVITAALRVTNPAGGSDIDTVGVAVLTPEQALLDLIDDVAALRAGGELNHGQSTGLSRQLGNALRSLEAGRTAAACSQLEDFIDRVAELAADGALPGAIADTLEADADAVGSAIGCAGL